MKEAEEKMTGYASIDKPWLKYYSDEAVSAPLPECTVYENIYQHNKDFLSQVALEYYGTKISYKKLFEQVEVCAKALLANGISQGSIVSICSSGVPEITYLLLACSKIGAVANFINPLFETQQKINRINDTNSTILFVLDKMYSYMKDVITNTCVEQIVIVPAVNALPVAIRMIVGLKDKLAPDMTTAIKNGNYILWNDFIKRGKDYHSTIQIQYKKSMSMIMVYSSGTTGESKGIVLTNDGINATITQYETAFFSEEKRGDKFLHNVPIWFSTGVSISLLMPLCLGVVCILEPVFSPESFLEDIIKYKPNYALVATGLWLYVMEHINEDYNLSFLKCPITGGEQMLGSTEILINDFLKKHNCKAKIQKGWGMCELGATAATSVFSEYNKLETVGIPMPLAVISAFDVDSGNELRYNERGELRVQTPCKMKEYYNSPDATEEFFKVDLNENIWGCTGDVGYVDEDGFVFVLGRASDYFIAQDNKKYYLFDIENIILLNNNIDICEVVTIDSTKYGREILTAHIILKKGFAGDINDLIIELDTMCKEKLPPCTVPLGYKVRKSFMIKPSGKRDTLSLKNEHEDYLCVIDREVKRISID
ncbi:MAG: acyl--CoA ligase [Roseburia sp.]|nr:acyl--CoA ligase [Roseburia sp.]